MKELIYILVLIVISAIVGSMCYHQGHTTGVAEGNQNGRRSVYNVAVGKGYGYYKVTDFQDDLGNREVRFCWNDEK